MANRHPQNFGCSIIWLHKYSVGKDLLNNYLMGPTTLINIDGLASFRSLMGKIMTDSLLENLYLLYN